MTTAGGEVPRCSIVAAVGLVQVPAWAGSYYSTAVLPKPVLFARPVERPVNERRSFDRHCKQVQEHVPQSRFASTDREGEPRP